MQIISKLASLNWPKTRNWLQQQSKNCHAPGLANIRAPTPQYFQTCVVSKSCPHFACCLSLQKSVSVDMCHLTKTTRRLHACIFTDGLTEGFGVQPPHKVNLTTPSKSILVQLLKSSCALAVADGYRAYSKYNIKELCGLGASNNPKPASEPAIPDEAAQAEPEAEA